MQLRIGCVVFGLLAACGGGSDDGEPLVSGSLTAEYDGVPFTPVFGFATIYQDSGLIGLGDGPIRCGTEDDDAPPRGDNAVFGVPLEPGTYGSVLVQMFHNDGSFEGVGSSSGSVTIASVTAETVAGEIAFSYTDEDGRSFAIAGTFEVVNCAP